MGLTFYPFDEDLAVANTLKSKIEVLLEGAQRIRDLSTTLAAAGRPVAAKPDAGRPMTPKELTYSFNWSAISRIFEEVRNLPDSQESTKKLKNDCVQGLLQVYEALPKAKMPKLAEISSQLMNSKPREAGAGASVQQNSSLFRKPM